MECQQNSQLSNGDIIKKSLVNINQGLKCGTFIGTKIKQVHYLIFFKELKLNNKIFPGT